MHGLVTLRVRHIGGKEMVENMKMGTKVMCAVLLMAVIVLIVGMVGIAGMGQINQSRDEIAKVMLPGIIKPEIINEAQTAIQRGERIFSLFSEYTERIAKGEVSPKVAEKYKGESDNIFFEMIAKNNPY